jgi:hypothetical protein
MADPQDESPGGGPEPMGGGPSGSRSHSRIPHRESARHSAPEDWTLAGGSAEGRAEGAGIHGGQPECLEWCPICRGADVLRATTSPELREQWNQVQREALLTLRALIDHYIEHLESQPRRAHPVEEIPVE